MKNPVKEIILILNFGTILLQGLPAQDRFPETDGNIVYPERMLIQNEGNIIDVTNIPAFISDHRAYPDGTRPEETTRALIDCYDFLVDHPERGGIIYFPEGKYLINNTIVYSGKKRVNPTARDIGHERISRVRFRGQSRAGVLIRLADNCPGFGDKDHPKNMISFGRHVQNNSVSTNFFENISLNTGRGNPGAVALRFHGANNEDIRNVSIRSEDGEGYIGLDLPMGACQGYYVDISIQGFDYGIHASYELATSLSFEFVTLKDQKVSGIWVEDVSIGIRKLHCVNAPAAVILTHGNGLLNLIDSELEGSGVEGPAIDIRRTGKGTGYVLARNVDVSGYGASVTRAGRTEVEGDIGEYVSGGPVSLFSGSSPRTLNLPVEVTPVIPWQQDFGDWAFVNDFGADGSDRLPDSDAIQAALNAGKSQVFFMMGEYIMDKPVHVPPHVKRINFMYSDLFADGNVEDLPVRFKDSDKGGFVVDPGSDAPLILEDLRINHGYMGHHWLVDHASTRTLILSDIHMQRGQMYRNSVEGGRVFIENCSPRSESQGLEGLTPFVFRGQKAWLRYVNPEHSRLEMLVDHSDVWLFGFKKEGWGSAFRIINGSRFEMLSGFGSTWGWGIESRHHTRGELEKIPLIIIEDSRTSISAVTLGNTTEFYDIIVRETRNGESRDLYSRDLPRKDNGHILLPLYLGNY